MAMKCFRVYPKKGEPFDLELRRFSVNDRAFTLYNSSDEPSNDGFLSFENVAAVHDTNQRRPDWEDVRCFEVRLIDRTEPLKVFAHYFKSDRPPSVEFYWINIKGPDDIRIENIYIALSEVVSITPTGGLTKYA
jgi:hypothetical protein